MDQERPPLMPDLVWAVPKGADDGMAEYFRLENAFHEETKERVWRRICAELEKEKNYGGQD